LALSTVPAQIRLFSMKSLMIVGVLVTLSISAHGQLTNQQIETVRAVCPKAIKPFCDALTSIRDEMAGSGKMAAPNASCNASQSIGAPRLSLIVVLGNSSCANQVNVDCTDNQGNSVLNQILSLATCLLTNVGPTVSNAVTNVQQVLGSPAPVVQVVLLIVYVLLEKVIKATCKFNADQLLRIAPFGIFILLVGVAYGLASLGLSATIITLAVTLTVTLLAVTNTGVLGLLVNSLLPLVKGLVSTAANLLVGVPTNLCGSASTSGSLVAKIIDLFAKLG
jgi:hypothetical protein